MEGDKLLIPVKLVSNQIRGNGFVIVSDVFEIDESRESEFYDPSFVTPTTVVIPYDRNKGPNIKDWLTMRGADPEIWFIEGASTERVAFRFNDGNEAAAFKLFFA